MKKLTYGLDRHTITLRRVTLEGDLNSSDRERYSVSVKKDLTPALSMLECALIQVNYSASRKAAELDQNRDMMVKRVGLSAADNSIYIPTLCIIGSIMHIHSKHKIFDLKDISNAVLNKNELWSQGVEDFNSLFSQDGVRCLKKAVRHPQGRRILNRFLAGLRFVTDLLYESYALKKDGLFEESLDIDDIISDIGITQTDAYMLLLSPLHPEHQILIEFIEDYRSCHELYISDVGRWVMVNKRAVKHVNIERLESHLQALDSGVFGQKIEQETQTQEDMVVGTAHPTERAEELVSAEDVIKHEVDEVDLAELETEKDIEDVIEQGLLSDSQEEPDFDSQEEPSFDNQEEPDFDDQQEPDPDEQVTSEDQASDTEVETTKDNKALYSAQRRRPEIRKPIPTQTESSQSLFSRPSNAEGVNFDVSDI